MKNFREMVGILGLEDAPFMSDRIFTIMDTDGDNIVI